MCEKERGKERQKYCWKSWVTEVLVCMIWFLFTPLSVPGEREMLTDERRQKSDEGLRRRVNELFPQAVLLTMRVSIEPLMTGGCSIAHTSTLPPLLFAVYCHPFLSSFYLSLARAYIYTHTLTRMFPQTSNQNTTTTKFSEKATEKEAKTNNNAWPGSLVAVQVAKCCPPLVLQLESQECK